MNTSKHFIIGLVIAAMGGCGARSDGEIGGKTSWLSRCTRDADCSSLEDGLCVQHLCTTRCEPASCDAVKETVCAPANEARCVSEPTCLPTCSRSQDCEAYGPDYECLGSVCVRGCEVPSDEDASVESGPGEPLDDSSSGTTSIGSNDPTDGGGLEPSPTESAPATSSESSGSPAFTSSASFTSSAASLLEPSTASAPSDETSGDLVVLPPLTIEDNLLANSDFETGVEPWTVMGNAVITRSEKTAHTGSASLLCSSRTMTWEGPAISVLPLLEPGKSYVLSAYVLADDTDVFPFHVVAHQPCLTDAGTAATEVDEYVQLGTGFGSNGEWLHLQTAPFSLPSCSLDEFTLYIEGPMSGTSFFLDDVALVEYAP